MATKKLVARLVEGWLSFSPRKINQDEAETLSRNYLSAFKAYKDFEIEQASSDYTETGEFYPPRPAQIISLVKNSEQSRHDRELVERWTCAACHQKTSSITSEGVCLDCSGVPVPVYQNVKPLQKPSPQNYRIEGRIRCHECGNVGMCIKEPPESGEWLCRRCYGGLSDKEMGSRFKTLGNKVNALD